MVVYRVALDMVKTLHTEVMPLARAGDRELADQLHRASRSVVLNTAEALGFDRGKRQRNHFRIALGSGRETMACLEMLVATGVVDERRAASARARADRVNAMLFGLTR